MAATFYLGRFTSRLVVVRATIFTVEIHPHNAAPRIDIERLICDVLSIEKAAVCPASFHIAAVMPYSPSAARAIRAHPTITVDIDHHYAGTFLRRRYPQHRTSLRASLPVT